MNLATVATLAGYKSHYTADGIKTLCGREASNGTSGIDMCKACVKAADKLTQQANTDRFIAESDARLAAAGIETAAQPTVDVYAAYDAEDAQRAEDNRIGALYDGEMEPTPATIMATVTATGARIEYAYIPNGDRDRVEAFMRDARSHGTLTDVTVTWDAAEREAEEIEDTAEVAASLAAEVAPVVPTLVIEPVDRTHVRVTLADHTKTFRDGSDVRLRAALWSRGLGYRPATGRALTWHRDGKLSVASVSLA